MKNSKTRKLLQTKCINDTTKSINENIIITFIIKQISKNQIITENI